MSGTDWKCFAGALSAERYPENTEGADLQRKLELLNSIMDQEARAEQARRQLQYYGHSGYSEDSDYTSDLNYPVGQHANSSASQFRSAAHQMCTPQRSLETSRENSYERDDVPQGQGHYYGGSGDTGRRYSDNESEPLFYNSRPKNYKEYNRRKKKTWDAEESPDTWYGGGSYDGPYPSHEQDGRIYQDGDSYYNTSVPAKKTRSGTNRRPSLERQTTLYDDQYYADGYYGTDQKHQSAYRGYDHSRSYSSTDYYSTSADYPYQDDKSVFLQTLTSYGCMGILLIRKTKYELNFRIELYVIKVSSVTDTSCERKFNLFNSTILKIAVSIFTLDQKEVLKHDWYGQEDEDRQWDSGGYYYKSQYGARDHYENRVNIRRTANRKVDDYATTGKVGSQEEGEDEYYSPQGGLSYEEDYTGNEYPPPTANAINSTPATTRRRVPHRRPSSRQSSTEGYDYIPTGGGGYYDDYRHHPGGTVTASINSTATTTTTAAYSSPTSLGRTNQLPKPPSSGHKHQLPPTPMRQLPHHSATDTATTTTATARRSNALLSRTSSAEYADQDNYSDSYSTYYNSSRGVGKNSGYNEDYNYAYRSIDNLATSQQDSVDESNEVTVHDKRTNDGRLSAGGTRGYQQTTPTAQRRNSAMQQRQNSEEYYYNAQDVNDFVNEEDMGYYNDTPITRNDSRKKFLAGRGDNSPLLQQNTDSLESRDDELRDSFETAVSSVTSSAQHRRGVNDYSTATETMMTPVDMIPTAVSIPATTTTPVPALIGNHVPPQTVQHRSSVGLDNRDQEPSSKTAANTASSVVPPVSSPTSAIVATTTLNTTASAITSTVNNTVLPPHSGYHSQTSVHSRGCLRAQDSLDSRAEEMTLHNAGIDYYTKSMNFRDSPPSVLLDRYGTDTPPLRGLNSLIEPYQPQPNKAPSVHASPSPPSMMQKQQSLDEQSHTSVIESPTASVDRQSSQGQAEKSKSVSFEDEEEVKPERRKMTVRERWHWAYNKIIMQLNVSRLSSYNKTDFRLDI
ncbi:hypothetical protein B7P43_G03529 [Cryptotermes secundus]|uniref:Uncharacterized protein n=1 Tax=Cryptotermes secundus TaxID=105785 RepID=A0A2J7R555_9NEOP|nr:hypothetical protein B7P43_G03529 [Cryptotermes secundus]